MKQLLDQESMLDRTIDRIEKDCDSMLIFFHDSTFVKISGGTTSSWGDDFDFCLISNTPLHMDEQLYYDLISQDEYDEWDEEMAEQRVADRRRADTIKLKRLAEELGYGIESLC
jgi:hypothetical protein